VLEVALATSGQLTESHSMRMLGVMQLLGKNFHIRLSDDLTLLSCKDIFVDHIDSISGLTAHHRDWTDLAGISGPYVDI
jgi:hypothetical protein